MSNTITLDAAALMTMSRDEVFAAMGRADLATASAQADAATRAARRTVRTRDTAPIAVDATAPCVVLCSNENNPLA